MPEVQDDSLRQFAARRVEYAVAENLTPSSGQLCARCAVRRPAYDRDCLFRTRRTESQGRFNARARADNVRGAFSVKKPAAIKGRRIVLIDDVFTTGATLEACARSLKRAGAAQVDGILH